MKTKVHTQILPVLGLLVFLSSAFAAAPNLLNYQGRLTTPGGTAVVDNTYAVTFSIYSVPSGGVALWTETQAVNTVGGIFSAILGSTTSFGSTVFADTTRYLGIKVGADPEISPRSRLTSVPFAMSSNSGWADDGTAVRLNTNTDYVGIGTSTPIHQLHVVDPSGGLFVSRIESSNTGGTVTEISNTSANSVWEASVAGSNGIPFWGVQPGDMYFYKQGTSWPNAVLTSGGSLGLGTSLPRARVEAVTLDTIAGLFLSAGATSATKVLRAEYTGADLVDATAVYGKSAPGDYYGFGGQFEGGYMGVTGTVIQHGSQAYYGVAGFAEGNGNGTKVGVRGTSSGSAGIKQGIYGEAVGSTGLKYGVYGLAAGDFGSHAGYFTATGQASYGVYASAEGIVAKGIYARADGSGNTGVYSEVFTFDSYAGYFKGMVGVVGTLSKSAGSFKIDHPMDPDNKYLQHSFVESPDMMNIYNGNVTTDRSGNAVIPLPNWFEALNKDFRYQLTVIGQFAQAIVSSKVSNNQFSVRTDKPNVEVSWQITGIRKDAYAEAHRIEVEIVKKPKELGKYLHPELYGKGREMSVDYDPQMEREHPSPSGLDADKSRLSEDK